MTKSMTPEIPIVTEVAFVAAFVLLAVPEFAFEGAESTSFVPPNREFSAANFHRLFDPTTQHRFAVRWARESLEVQTELEFDEALFAC